MSLDRPLRLLMVDDDEDEYVLVRSLELPQHETPWQLDWEPDIERALDRILAGTHDICLVDYRMGEKDGLDLIRRAVQSGCQIPLIMLTGQGTEDLDEIVLSAGAADYLDKRSLTGPMLSRSVRYALARQQDQAQIRLQERAIQATTTGICISSADPERDFPVTFINPAFVQLTGYSEADILGKNCRILQGADRDQPALAVVRDALKQGRSCRVVLRNYRKDGELFWNELNLAPIEQANGQVTHFVATQLDVTRQKHAEIQASMAQSQLQLQATHDRLTGLPNRNLLEDRLQQAMGLARRQREGLAVMALDLDRFAELNDSYGFAVGNDVLQQIANRIQNTLRSTDTLSRDSGDEFIMLIPGPRTTAEVATLYGKISTAVSERVLIQGHAIRMTASMGVALWEDDQVDAPSLIRQATQAVQQAKRNGRNTYVIYSESHDDIPGRRLNLSSQFQDAISEQQFLLHYQPQVDTRQQALRGMEALVRWQHPELGLLPPSQFIPIAEDSGHIVALGSWILNAACLQNRQWLDQGLIELPVAVNVSALQFNNPGFVNSVADALSNSGLPASLLELELTESMMFNSLNTVVHRLNQLKSLGVRLSIDDFGTGYSNLAYLKSLPIDQLKIDRRFVTDLQSSQEGAVIVRTIIGLARNLQLSVLAEGVETRVQLNYLSQHGCDLVQGYLISPPMSPAALAEFVQQHQGRLQPQKEDAPILLLVDDEDNILQALRRVFRHEGYRILTASNATDALQMVETEPVQVILTDQSMPGQNGVDLLQQVRNRFPQIVRLVLTGYTDIATVTRAINESAAYKFIAKPWDDDELRQTVRDAFVRYHQ